MAMADTIRRKLNTALKPTLLEIVDDSHRHAGHAGARPGGETHFNVKIVSEAFIGKSRIERQRMVFRALEAELADRIHALALITRAPGEES